MSRLAYGIAYCLAWPFVRLFYHFRGRGSDNVPDGPAIVCANHSHAIDPFILAFACGKRHWLHFMAKAEIFKKPLLGGILRAIGTFPVDRGRSDAGAIRSAIRLLKSGEKIMMFPEGTRVADDDSSDAKTGAVKLAARMNVPIVPAYIPRDKRIFRRFEIVVGEPYYINADKRLTPERYEDYASELMRRINSLRPEKI